MRTSRLSLPLVLALPVGVLAACGSQPPESEPIGSATELRVALFNVQELSAAKLDEVDAAGLGHDPQLRAAAAIVQRARPDVLILNEIDFDAAAPLARGRQFVDRYLASGPAGIDFPHLYAAPSNTGLLSGFDLDNDGLVATEANLGERQHGGDSWGFGVYPGQYAMAVLSRLPIAIDKVRTFQELRWVDLPGNHLPVEFYDVEERQALRLSSKSHWDVPVQVGETTTLHLWISHPTPPVFDGDEDRNGRRNFDEIGFWVVYLEGAEALYDDDGRRGGFGSAAPFVIAGDLNAHPQANESIYDGRNAISQLLEHAEIQDPGEVLVSRGGLGDRAAGPPDYPERSTADFLGGRRIDYLLPRRGVEVRGGGVFWPAEDEDPQGHALAAEASDHRMLWLDLRPDATSTSD